MKLNNNHLLLFAFAIAAGLYIWNMKYPGKKDAFYAKQVSAQGTGIAALVILLMGIAMAFAAAMSDNFLLVGGSIFFIYLAGALSGSFFGSNFG